MARVSTVTLVDLPALRCPYCGQTAPADAGWAVSAVTVWGWCGVKLNLDDQVAATLLLAPLEEPGRALLTSLWVRPEYAGAGYGRQLVQAAAAGLVERKDRTLLANGSRHTVHCAAPPAEFLRAVGFVRPRGERLWQLDLARTISTPDGVRGLLSRFLQVIRPVSPPEPAGGAVRGRTG